ncbi:MAG TPA: SDR family oxidoreductase [Terriglobales bacterium]|nr:SDR family oxidoreductase [Terriglobales bacterium]
MKIVRNSAFALGAAAGAVLATRALLSGRGNYDLRGKNILITGGSRGLGLVLAREFAKQGARIAICARNAAALERARLDLARLAHEVHAIPCDITSKIEVDEMVRTVREKLGSIDVLVNNAGVIAVGPMETMTIEDYQESIDTHFWGPLYTTLAVLPQMRERRSGRIVNISSIGGIVSVPHLLPYSAGKFALTGFSQGLRAELLKDNIYVTTVCPGLMRTGSARNAEFKGKHRAEYSWFSLGGSLPIISMDSDRAVRQIVAACRRGTAEVVLSVPFKIAARIHGLMPGTTANVLGLVNRVLPGPGGIGTTRARGYESSTPVSESFLTAMNKRAAERNNEVA